MLLSFCLCCLVVAKEYILSSSPPTLSSSRWGCGCQSGPWFRSTLSVSWVLWFCSFPILLSKMFVSLNFLRKSLMATFIKPGRRGSRCDNPQWKRGWSDLGNSWKILHLKVFIFYLISSFLSLRTAHQSFFKWTLTWRLCCDNQQWSDNRQRHCRSTSWFASHRLSRSSPVGDSWYIIIMELLPFFNFCCHKWISIQAYKKTCGCHRSSDRVYGDVWKRWEGRRPVGTRSLGTQSPTAFSPTFKKREKMKK